MSVRARELRPWLRLIARDTRLTLSERAAVLTIASLTGTDLEAVCGSNRLSRILGVSRWVAAQLLSRLIELELLETAGPAPRAGEVRYRLRRPTETRRDEDSADQ